MITDFKLELLHSHVHCCKCSYKTRQGWIWLCAWHTAASLFFIIILPLFWACKNRHLMQGKLKLHHELMSTSVVGCHCFLKNMFYLNHVIYHCMEHAQQENIPTRKNLHGYFTLFSIFSSVICYGYIQKILNKYTCQCPCEF